MARHRLSYARRNVLPPVCYPPLPACWIDAFPKLIQLGDKTLVSWRSSDANLPPYSDFGATGRAGSLYDAPAHSRDYNIRYCGHHGQAAASVVVQVAQPAIPEQHTLWQLNYTAAVNVQISAIAQALTAIMPIEGYNFPIAPYAMISLPLPTWYPDPTANEILIVNDAAGRTIGYDLIGWNFHNMIEVRSIYDPPTGPPLALIYNLNVLSPSFPANNSISFVSGSPLPDSVSGTLVWSSAGYAWHNVTCWWNDWSCHPAPVIDIEEISTRHHLTLRVN